MTEDKTKSPKTSQSGVGGGLYFLGFIGAAVYFLENADSFGRGVVGVLKALVWPAFLVYQLFEFLGR